MKQGLAEKVGWEDYARTGAALVLSAAYLATVIFVSEYYLRPYIENLKTSQKTSIKETAEKTEPPWPKLYNKPYPRRAGNEAYKGKSLVTERTHNSAYK